jgi:antitoxin component of RelBE/YafQ-DinJ toxin-antitoxin module
MPKENKKHSDNSTKAVTFNMSMTTYNNMLDVCHVLGIKPSEFMRLAITQYISQASMQSSCINLARILKTIKFDGLDNEKAEELEKILTRLGTVGGVDFE